VAVKGVRTPDMPFVALSASAVRRRTAVHWSGDVRCPRVRCPHDRRDPGVRTDTPPVSAASASALSTRAGSWNASGRGRDGRRLAVGGSHQVDGRRPLPRMRRGCGAALAAWPTTGAGSSARVPVGWLEHEKDDMCRDLLRLKHR
jgi:hypothetical protein